MTIHITWASVLAWFAGLLIYLGGKEFILHLVRLRKARKIAYCQRPGHNCGCEGAGPCNGLPRERQ